MTVLLDTPKRPKIPSSDTNNPQDGGHQQDPEILKYGEHNPAQHHQERPAHQYPSPAYAVGDQRQERAEQDVAQEREGHEDADLVVGILERREEDG